MKISLTDCSVKIKNALILQKLNFEIQKGTCYHLRGENGAGKSVFLQAILGLVPFSTGSHEITYDKADLCYITSIPFYFDNEKVSSVIKLLATLYKTDSGQYTDILSLLGLSYSELARKRMCELSQGTRQKIVLSALFTTRASFFVLDEIFVGVDQQTQTKVINRITDLATKKQTLILVEHNEALMARVKQKMKMEELVCKNQTVLRA